MKKCYVNVSIGELWDKYSILQIKLKKVENEDYKSEITREIEQVKIEIENNPISKELYSDLYLTNTKLWDIENNIREKERKQEFDLKFIDLARSVYKYNDMRGKIKSDINHTYNSYIKEVKSYSSY